MPILLLSVILLGSLKDVVVYGTFVLNRQYIASNLCKERYISTSSCGGSCILMELIEQNHAETPEAPTRIGEEQIQLFQISSNNIFSPCPSETIDSVIPVLRKDGLILNAFLHGVFHPPKS
jgi:hypothetical protein